MCIPLTGTDLHPGILRLDIYRRHDNRIRHDVVIFKDAWNDFGHFPGLSTVTGLIRAVNAVALATLVLVRSVFFCGMYSEDVEDLILAVVNFARGVVEMVPFAGNFMSWLYDNAQYALETERARHAATRYRAQIERAGSVTLIANGHRGTVHSHNFHIGEERRPSANEILWRFGLQDRFRSLNGLPLSPSQVDTTHVALVNHMEEGAPLR